MVVFLCGRVRKKLPKYRPIDRSWWPVFSFGFWFFASGYALGADSLDTKQLLESAETIRIIRSLFVSEPNQWLPVLAAIGGALVGGLTTAIPAVWRDARARQAERVSVTTALVAEVSAMLAILERRRYLHSMRELTERLKGAGQDCGILFSVRVPDHYSRVYQANVARLGVVDPLLAAKLIEFHQLVDAIVQDITPDGVFGRGEGDLAGLKQMVDIGESAVAVGAEILRIWDRRRT